MFNPNLKRFRKEIFRKGGFTRLDLVVLLGMVGLLAAWLEMGFLGERGRTAYCAKNLAALGKAIHSYANEHDGALPAAGINIGKFQSSWDGEILSHLNSSQRNSGEKLGQAASRPFACPSDNIPRRGKMRSYAMSGNDMALENWPPGLESKTGVGLFWNQQTSKALLDSESPPAESLPTLKLSGIPSPSDTVLLTEFPDSTNCMGSFQDAVVFSDSQPWGGRGSVQHHGGRFNYLMADGHVELLSVLQAGGGIWNLKKEN